MMHRSYNKNPAKATPLGDGAYIRRWHGNDGTGVEIGTRNGDREFDQVFLGPDAIQALLKYIEIEGHHLTQPPATERAAHRTIEYV